MKIAVATMDGQNLSQHFGQSAGFVVFDVQGSSITTRELRSSQSSLHSLMHCDPAEAPSPNGGISGLIGDCEVVLVGGIGAGAVLKLKELGLRSIMMPAPSTIEESLARYLRGEFHGEATSSCNCHH